MTVVRPLRRRCDAAVQHLRVLSTKYLPTKFIFLNVTKAPFFVAKLQIKVIPTIVCFKDGACRPLRALGSRPLRHRRGPYHRL